MLLYLSKRARPDCLAAVSYLATSVTKCDTDDVGKLVGLVRYIRGTREMGVVLRPGDGCASQTICRRIIWCPH